MSLFAALNARVNKGPSVISPSISDSDRAVPPSRSLSFRPGPNSSAKSNRRREFDESIYSSSLLTHSFKTDPVLGTHLRTRDRPAAPGHPTGSGLRPNN